jgi:hypothetical protein
MKKRVFLAGWDVRLNGDIQCDNYIATQITTEEVVQNLLVVLNSYLKMKS